MSSSTTGRGELTISSARIAPEGEGATLVATPTNRDLMRSNVGATPQSRDPLLEKQLKAFTQRVSTSLHALRANQNRESFEADLQSFVSLLKNSGLNSEEVDEEFRLSSGKSITHTVGALCREKRIETLATLQTTRDLYTWRYTLRDGSTPQPVRVWGELLAEQGIAPTRHASTPEAKTQALRSLENLCINWHRASTLEKGTPGIIDACIAFKETQGVDLYAELNTRYSPEELALVHACVLEDRTRIEALQFIRALEKSRTIADVMAYFPDTREFERFDSEIRALTGKQTTELLQERSFTLKSTATTERDPELFKAELTIIEAVFSADARRQVYEQKLTEPLRARVDAELKAELEKTERALTERSRALDQEYARVREMLESAKFQVIDAQRTKVAEELQRIAAMPAEQRLAATSVVFAAFSLEDFEAMEARSVSEGASVQDQLRKMGGERLVEFARAASAQDEILGTVITLEFLVESRDVSTIVNTLAALDIDDRINTVQQFEARTGKSLAHACADIGASPEHLMLVRFYSKVHDAAALQEALGLKGGTLNLVQVNEVLRAMAPDERSTACAQILARDKAELLRVLVEAAGGDETLAQLALRLLESGPQPVAHVAQALEQYEALKASGRSETYAEAQRLMQGREKANRQLRAGAMANVDSTQRWLDEQDLLVSMWGEIGGSRSAARADIQNSLILAREYDEQQKLMLDTNLKARRAAERAKLEEKQLLEALLFGRQQEALRAAERSNAAFNQMVELVNSREASARPDLSRYQEELREFQQRLDGSIQSLNNWETGLKVTRTAVIIVGGAAVVVATGGAALPAWQAALAVTAFATPGTIVQGTLDVQYGNKSVGEAALDSGLQVISDFCGAYGGNSIARSVGQSLWNMKTVLSETRLANGTVIKAGTKLWEWQLHNLTAGQGFTALTRTAQMASEWAGAGALLGPAMNETRQILNQRNPTRTTMEDDPIAKKRVEEALTSKNHNDLKPIDIVIGARSVDELQKLTPPQKKMLSLEEKRIAYTMDELRTLPPEELREIRPDLYQQWYGERVSTRNNEAVAATKVLELSAPPPPPEAPPPVIVASPSNDRPPPPPDDASAPSTGNEQFDAFADTMLNFFLRALGLGNTVTAQAPQRAPVGTVANADEATKKVDAEKTSEPQGESRAPVLEVANTRLGNSYTAALTQAEVGRAVQPSLKLVTQDAVRESLSREELQRSVAQGLSEAELERIRYFRAQQQAALEQAELQIRLNRKWMEELAASVQQQLARASETAEQKVVKALREEALAERKAPLVNGEAAYGIAHERSLSMKEQNPASVPNGTTSAAFVNETPQSSATPLTEAATRIQASELKAGDILRESLQREVVQERSAMPLASAIEVTRLEISKIHGPADRMRERRTHITREARSPVMERVVALRSEHSATPQGIASDPQAESQSAKQQQTVQRLSQVFHATARPLAIEIQRSLDRIEASLQSADTARTMQHSLTSGERSKLNSVAVSDVQLVRQAIRELLVEVPTISGSKSARTDQVRYEQSPRSMVFDTHIVSRVQESAAPEESSGASPNTYWETAEEQTERIRLQRKRRLNRDKKLRRERRIAAIKAKELLELLAIEASKAATTDELDERVARALVRVKPLAKKQKNQTAKQPSEKHSSAHSRAAPARVATTRKVPMPGAKSRAALYRKMRATQK